MLRLAARLPDPLVGLLPDRLGALGLGLDQRPQPARQPLAAARVQQHRVERGAEHIVLALVERAVAGPHGAGAVVATEILEELLGQVATTVDPVHDLQPAVVVALEVGDELHELVGLPVEVEVVQRLERERRVADPRVPVVPVALPARGLGQRRGQRGDGRARRHVRQALDRERRALDQRPELVVGDAGPRQPVAPEPRRGLELGVGLLDGGRHRRLVIPGERAEQLLALVEHVPGADVVGLDPEQHVGLQPHRLTGARSRRRGGDPASATIRRAPGRSRTPARTPARPRRCPRCT